MDAKSLLSKKSLKHVFRLYISKPLVIVDKLISFLLITSHILFKSSINSITFVSLLVLSTNSENFKELSANDLKFIIVLLFFEVIFCISF